MPVQLSHIGEDLIAAMLASLSGRRELSRFGRPVQDPAIAHPRIKTRVTRLNAMTYRGHVKNGVVVFDSPTSLPEGTSVEISVGDWPMDIEGEPIHPAFLIGDLAIDMGVDDLGKNIDHYLYGHPKVEDEQ